MNILPFPATGTAKTRTLPFLLTPKKPASTAALEAALAAQPIPLAERYRLMRLQYPADFLLLFKLGDFYEIMGESDARIAASLMGIALTKRNDIPMCGFPHHAAEAIYIPRLLEGGRRLAIAEKTESGDHQVSRILTPPSEIQTPAPPLTPSPAPLPPTRKQALAALAWLQENNFIGKPQAACVKDLIRTSEEWEFFAAKMVEIKDMIEAMPHTYQQDGKGNDAIAYLHYFGGSYDAYITEKDKGNPGEDPSERQWQAHGLSSFGEDPELGYICLPEILATGRIELDFHFTPTTLRKIKGIPDEPKASERPASDSEPSPEPHSAHLMGVSQLQTPTPPLTPSPAPLPTPAPDISETLAILQQQYLTAEATEPGAGWKPGALLVETWGYEQTNKDFYQIVERTAKSITIVPIEAVKTRHKDQPGGTDAMRGTSMPGQSIQSVAPIRRKLDMSTCRPFAKVNHGYLDLWKGTPESWTDYA